MTPVAGKVSTARMRCSASGARTDITNPRGGAAVTLKLFLAAGVMADCVGGGAKNQAGAARRVVGRPLAD